MKEGGGTRQRRERREYAEEKVREDDQIFQNRNPSKYAVFSQLAGPVCAGSGVTEQGLEQLTQNGALIIMLFIH